MERRFGREVKGRTERQMMEIEGVEQAAASAAPVCRGYNGAVCCCAMQKFRASQ